MEKKNKLQAVRNFLNGKIFALSVFILGTVIVLLGADNENALVYGALAFVILMSALLLISDVLAPILPAMLAMSVFVCKCYNSFNTFIQYWWCGAVFIMSLIIHLIIHPKKLVPGKSFKGIVCVAVAVTLGGLGTISFSDYFHSAYYIIGLGAGMVLAYLIIAADISSEDYDRRASTFVFSMFMFGVLCVIMTGANIKDVLNLSGSEINGVQYNNNLSTMIMFSMPFAFYYSRKNFLYSFIGTAMYLSLLALGSRGGMIMGSVEYAVCVVYSILINKKRLGKLLNALPVLCLAVIAVIMREKVFEIIKNAGSIVQTVGTSEARLKLIARSLNDFLSNPIFGSGLGHRGNTDLYNPVKGAMTWYHMMVPQVVGSLGALGIAAYLYQFKNRIQLIFRKINPYTMCLGISYLGILLMSQVNPGEFCPIPYELITVIIFVMLEKMSGGRKRRHGHHGNEETKRAYNDSAQVKQAD